LIHVYDDESDFVFFTTRFTFIIYVFSGKAVGTYRKRRLNQRRVLTTMIDDDDRQEGPSSSSGSY
jgi:hypothetical protein